MARLRIRTLKPELFDDEKIIGFPVAGRYTAIGLVTLADDRGRMRHSISAMHGHIFPDEIVSVGAFEKLLKQIISSGFVLAYEHGGRRYLWVQRFWWHQIISKPSDSQLPAHPADPYGHLPIDKALKAFRDDRKEERRLRDSGNDSGNGAGSSPVSVHADVHPLTRARAGSVPIGEQQTKTETTKNYTPAHPLADVLNILTSLPKWADLDPVGVENAAASDPDRDLIAAARLAVVWGSSKTWTQDAAATLRSTMRHLWKEATQDAATGPRTDRKTKDRESLERLMTESSQ